jgi:hypothetical protein
MAAILKIDSGGNAEAYLRIRMARSASGRMVILRQCQIIA